LIFHPYRINPSLTALARSVEWLPTRQPLMRARKGVHQCGIESVPSSSSFQQIRLDRLNRQGLVVAHACLIDPPIYRKFAQRRFRSSAGMWSWQASSIVSAL
jgi:hypothetical protein